MPRRFLVDCGLRAPRASGTPRTIIAFAVVLILIPLCVRSRPPERWWPGFAPPGPSGTVQTIVSYNDELIVGGAFTTMGALPASNIARWDGTAWRPFGSGADAPVRASIVYNGDLIVAGDFTSIDEVAANRIARWDGHSWSPLAGGIDGPVLCFALYDGDLYAAGAFQNADRLPVLGIARWNGTSWTPTGFEKPAWFNGNIQFSDLAVREGVLIALWGPMWGDDPVIGSSYFASWDGGSWSIGGPFEDPHAQELLPTSLVVHDGDIYATGLWPVGQHPGERVVHWVNGEWVPLGPEFPPTSLQLASYRGRLIVAQRASGAAEDSFLSEWTGSEWRPLDAGPIGAVHAFGQYGEDLVAGGAFGFADGPRVRGLAGWNGERWRPFGEFPGMGCDAAIYAIDASGDSIAVIGRFDFAGPARAASGALWDGDSWQGLSVSEPFSGFGHPFGRIAFLGTGIYASGDFEICDGHFCIYLDQWRDGTWEHISTFSNQIYALKEVNGLLYAGGSFSHIDLNELPARAIAAWNGGYWTLLGSGLDGIVFDIAAYKGGVVAGGAFDGTADDSTAAPRVAWWDGWRWHGFGDGPGFSVEAVIEHAGGLVAAGRASVSGQPPTYPISRWEGHSWSSLGDPPNDDVLRLAVYRGRLIAGGTFKRFGSAEVPYLAEWTGRRWIPFGGGVSAPVSGIAVREDDLFVVGGFETAGTTPSWHIARWSESLAAPAVFRVRAGDSLATLTGSLPDDPNVIGLVVRYAEGDFPTGFEGGDPLPGGSADGFFPGAPGSQFRMVHPQPPDGRRTCYAAYAVSIDGMRSAPLYGSFRRVDRTPPELRARVARNPHFGDSLVVEVNASEPLDSVRLQIHIDGRPRRVRSVDATALHWLATLPVPEAGDADTVDVCGSDSLGNEVCRTIYASGRRFRFGEGGRLTSPDGRLTIDLQSTSLQRDEVVSIVWDPHDAGGAHVYEFGPRYLEIGPALLEYRYDDAELGGADPRRLGIEGSPGGFLTSFVDPVRKTVTGWIDTLGNYRVLLGEQASSALVDPGFLQLDPPRPNPMATVGYLNFDLRDRVDVNVTIFDVMGRRVARPFRGLAGPGRQLITWDGRTDGGARVPSGIYFVRVSTPRARAVEKMIRLR